MRVTPKMSDRPAPTRKSDEAPASPLSSWTTNPDRSMAVWRPGCEGRRRSRPGRSGRRAHLLHFLVGGQVLGAVEVLVVDHGAGAVAVGGLADVGTHGGLVVEGAVGDLAERCQHLQPGECGDELLGVGALGLLHALGERLDGAVADHRTQPRVVLVLALVGQEERLVLRRLDA